MFSFLNYKIEARGQDDTDILKKDVAQIEAIEKNREIDKKHFIALCLHQVNYSGNALAITPEDLRNIVKEFKSKGYTFVDASDLREIYYGKKEMPDKAVFFGFDDGYEDNYIYAYNILKEENVKATFFIVSSELDAKGRLSVKEIKEMIKDGFSFGSHTVTHSDLTTLTDEQIDREFHDSQQYLIEKLGIPIFALAYPCGFKNNDVVNFAKKYYDIAFTATVDADQKETPFTIQRYGVFRWDKDISSILHNQQHESK